MFYWIIRALFFLPITILYPTKVIGKENLVKGKSILACNHQTNLDGVIIGIKLRKKISFLGKAELFKNKLMSMFFKGMQVIPVNRGKADLKAVKTVIKLLKNEGTLGVFPGGTRQQNSEDINELKNGVSLFAIKSNAIIIPMVFTKRPRLFKRNTLIIGKGFYLNKPKDKLTKEYLISSSKILTKEIQKLIIDERGEN